MTHIPGDGIVNSDTIGITMLYAEACKALREAAGDGWGEHSYLLGGWSDRMDTRTGKFVDGPCESWTPDLKVVRASTRFLHQTGRLSRSSNMRVE
jgi:hypothetical protein